MMEIQHGDVSAALPFIAVSTADNLTRLTGKVSGDFTVYYSLDNGTPVLMTTPTVAEAGAVTMPGCYWLDVDEAGMVALASARDVAKLMIHVTCAGMREVTLSVPVRRFFPHDDEELDTSTTPWSIKRMRRGETDVLARSYLRDIDGVDITGAGILVASRKDA